MFDVDVIKASRVQKDNVLPLEYSQNVVLKRVPYTPAPDELVLA